jgi:hypothetical protein
MARRKASDPPSPQMTAHLERLERVRAAQTRASEARRAGAPDADRLTQDAERIMRECGIAEEPYDVSTETEVPATPHNPSEIILVAIAQARANGDEASAKKLEAMLAHPEQAAELIRQLQQSARS